MRGFVGDHIDDEVETVRDGKCALVIAVESCKLEFFRLAVARSYRHLPAVGRESPGDGSADVAGSTDDEGALCDRGLRGDDGVAHADVAVVEDVRVEPTTMHETHDHSGLGHRLEVQARLAELDALTLDITDAEATADQGIEIDPPSQHVPARSGRLERDSVLGLERVDGLCCDQSDRATCRSLGLVEVPVALQSATGNRANTVDRSRQLPVLGRQKDSFDASLHSSKPILPQPPPPGVSIVATSPAVRERVTFAASGSPFRRLRPAVPGLPPRSPEGA